MDGEEMSFSCQDEFERMHEDDFERMHEDELEILNEMEGFDDELPVPKKVRKTLNFSDNQDSELVSKEIITSENAKEIGISQEFCGTEAFSSRDVMDDVYIGSDFLLHNELDPDYVIERIRMLRKEKQDNKFMHNFKQANSDTYSNEKERIHLRIPPGSFFRMETEDCTPYYFELKSLSDLKLSKDFKTATGLLSQSFKDVKESALNQCVNSHQDTKDATMVVSSVELWAEKYKPLHYLELLSDESTNRALLHWLKLWDKIVFGKEVSVNKPRFTKRKFSKAFFRHSDADELDASNRPMHKIALLCGNPGLGKTTLAHIVACHAGYNVVEMNASDDRSPAIFLQQIEAATQMRSVLTKSTKPNCLVIDEIDGASPAAINVLASYINGRRSLKKKNMILQRPIICICNDQYSPSLKPLKEHALIIKFFPMSTDRLAERLKQIVGKENMKSTSNALLSLADKTGCDIRSCLGTLQFLQTMKKEINSTIIDNMSVGLKDMQKTYFDLWMQVFSLPRNKGKVIDYQGICRESEVASIQKSRFEIILSSCQAVGEYEKIYQGLFENYLNVKFKDHHLESIVLGSEWLCFYDLVHSDIMLHQHFALYSYLPFPCVMFHFLYAILQKSVLKYPSKQFEFSTKQGQLNNILLSLLQDMPVQNKRMVDSQCWVMEIIPFLLSIITPHLRPVNFQLYSSKEKADLENVVKVMIDYNLTYHQERRQDGQYTYILEPNIQDFCEFGGFSIARRTLAYTTKQVIARGVELERVKSSESLGTTEVPKVTEKLPKLPTKVKENVPVDFFGRKLPDSSKKDSTNGEPTGVWFHFKEGFSNAVRKTIRIKDLCV